MAAIKPLDQSADKWTRRASVAGDDYKAGVTNPRTPWAAASAAAENTYKTAVTAAANAGRYSGGVRKAGDAKWSQNAAQKGPARYAEGVQLAIGNWQNGFGPYQQTIASLQLPARGPVGSPTNLQRVTTVTTALRQVKERSGSRA